MKVVEVIIALWSLLFLASCSITPTDPSAVPLEGVIVGKWREIGGTKTIQFFNEGTVISVSEDKATTAYYKVLDTEHLEIEPKYQLGAGLARTVIIRVSIHGDQLTLTDSGEILRFQREK